MANLITSQRWLFFSKKKMEISHLHGFCSVLFVFFGRFLLLGNFPPGISFLVVEGFFVQTWQRFKFWRFRLFFLVLKRFLR